MGAIHGHHGLMMPGAGGGDIRLVAFTQSRNAGQANATPATINSGAASANYYSAITVRLAP